MSQLLTKQELAYLGVEFSQPRFVKYLAKYNLKSGAKIKLGRKSLLQRILNWGE